jgi:hypothetical protein
MRMERAEPERVLATRSANGNWVWTFVLQERDGQTRLLSRTPFRLPTLARRIGMAPMIPGSLVLERKMLRGIKARAERLAAGPRRIRLDSVVGVRAASMVSARAGSASRFCLREPAWSEARVTNPGDDRARDWP